MSPLSVLGIIAVLTVGTQSFDWQPGNNGQVLWAEHCDFYGNDMYNVQGTSDQCGGQCLSNSQCTHFTWTEYNGGTCYLKQGPVSTDQATYYSDYSVCGVVVGGGQPGVTTRYWDCCKPSCSWPGKGPVSNPVQACQKDGWTPIDPNAASGCDQNPGPSFTCNNDQPWAVNDQLSYGFAAANIAGESEQDWCCACYQLTFTSGPVNGKQMVVQVTNSGGDLSQNHFDLLIPGGGVGLYNGCTPQWGAPSGGWGQQYGGVSSRDQCSQLPSVLQPGCQWRFDWFQGADNPNVNMVKVTCPDELVQKSNCRRNNE